ncbi:thiol-disulfide oxidoreductase [Ammoniphilus oxalaticus]|uniref:Thiol-disulfide oxidoreductase n=1 Tax=Ammoniphilus oxalaticus TaxID=66863 RepID=A0A419SN00_9BACL|nr:thiol-disulfide oxidoreductase ResA [Ammoniphilus oxalaticus]RKD25664.1 thiol-disulfide oxidoreductase [Ammoniphilus oxalaticus]
MMKRSRTLLRSAILGIIFIGIGVAIFNAFIKDTTVVKTGEPAPDFVLPMLDGETFQLSDYKGQGVVLNFWGSWCDPCEDEMPDLNRAYEAYKERGVTVIALNIGEPEVVVKPFRDQYQLDFPILMDRKKEISNNVYKIGPIPTTYFIDQHGTVQKKIVGGPMSEQTILENMKQIMPE